MFKKIIQFVKKYQLPLTMLVIMLLLPQMVGAQAFGNEVDAKIRELFGILNVIIQFLLVLLWPILLLIGGLMSNDLLFSGGMQTTLLNVWSGVRDFVNVMFILGLLGIAIVNILGIAKEEFQIKSVLPRIVLALIIVNFSFLGCKVVLDISNVISTSIFSLPLTDVVPTAQSTPDPGDQMEGSAPSQSEQQQFINKVCGNLFRLQTNQQQTQQTSDQQSGDSAGVSQEQYSQFCTGTEGSFQFTPSAQQFFGSFNSKNVAMIMAIQLMDITEIDKVNGIKVTGLKSLTINTLFSVVFVIIYATAFIALFVGLLVRIVVLWVIIVVSPLIALGWAIKPIGERLQVDGEDLLKVFIQHATMTIPVAVVLTIGTIMIDGVKKIAPNSVLSTNPAEFGAIMSGTTTVQSIIAGVGTAAFIWLAVAQTVTKGKGGAFAQTIMDAVGGGAKALAKVPLYIPLIPVKSGNNTGNVGLAALGTVLGKPQEYINEKEREMREILGSKEGQVKNDYQTAKTSADLKKAISTAVAQGVAHKRDFQKELAEKLTKDPRLAKEFQNMRFKVKGQEVGYTQFMEALKKGELTKQDFDDLVKNSNNKFPNVANISAVNNGKTASNKLAGSAGILGQKGVDEVPLIANKKKDLDKAVEDLAEGKANASESTVKTLTDEINQLRTSLDSINAMQLKNGQTLEPGQQEQIAKYMKSSGLNKADSQTVLTQIFEQKNIPNGAELAKNIVNEQFLAPPVGPGQTPAQAGGTNPQQPSSQGNPNPTQPPTPPTNP